MEANIRIFSLILSIRKVTASIFSANDEHSDARFLFDSFFSNQISSSSAVFKMTTETQMLTSSAHLVTFAPMESAEG